MPQAAGPECAIAHMALSTVCSCLFHRVLREGLFSSSASCCDLYQFHLPWSARNTFPRFRRGLCCLLAGVPWLSSSDGANHENVAHNDHICQLAEGQCELLGRTCWQGRTGSRELSVSVHALGVSYLVSHQELSTYQASFT